MTIYGLDFSHYDAVPAASRVVSEGFSFFTHKAGGDANDAEYGAWWQAMKGVRSTVLLGAYWVLRPDTSGSAVDKANAFCDRLDSQSPGWGNGPFILQVDCEKWNDSSATVPSKSYIQAFCARLRQRAPKLMPIIYAPKWCYGDSLNGLGYPLWASGYVSGSGAASALYPGDSSSKWNAYSGQTPAILQFTSSATALGQTTCDANAYRGTLQQLTALVAPGWKEDIDVALTNDDINAVALASANQTLKIDGVNANVAGAGDYVTNPEISLATGIHRIYDLVQTMYNAPAAPATVDVPALAAALAPLLNGVNEQEIHDALVEVLHSAS